MTMMIMMMLTTTMVIVTLEMTKRWSGQADLYSGNVNRLSFLIYTVRVVSDHCLGGSFIFFYSDFHHPQDNSIMQSQIDVSMGIESHSMLFLALMLVYGWS